jgi:phosphoglycerate dehydrogenase-like enzyme
MNDLKIAIVNSSSLGSEFKKKLLNIRQVIAVDKFTFESDVDGGSLARSLNGYNVIISGVTPFFKKDFFDSKDELYLISRHGIGYNNVDINEAKKHNTMVSLVPPLVERDAVAENNVTNLLSVMRQTISSNKASHEFHWEKRANFVGKNLSGKTVGVIGVGNIGSRLVEIFNYGFRCHVLGCDPNKSALNIESFGGEKASLELTLKNADIICLAASLDEESYHMIGKNEFELMKKGVFISNAARGALIEEGAMCKALETGKVAGYGADVLEEEPPSENQKLLSFENVIVTPHTSAYTKECLDGMDNKCFKDIVDLLNGKVPVRTLSAV